jgi:hypothetical protein
MFKIEQHLRKNFERSDDFLCDLEGLLLALDGALDRHPTLMSKCDESAAIFAIMRQILRLKDELRRARSQEWVGLGGNSHRLAEADIAEARAQ